MQITKITVGRLYNLGSYEHVRYELTVDVPAGESAATAIKAVEKLLAGLKPVKNIASESHADLQRQAIQIEEMKKAPAVDWQRRFGHYTGEPTEVIQRLQESLDEDTAKLQTIINRARRAREFFDDLGGAAKFKDAKLDWEDPDYEG